LLEEKTLNKVSDILSRNWKNESFQNRRTEFGAKANLKKKQCIKVVVTIIIIIIIIFLCRKVVLRS
jgi:hypothetical protein